MSPTRPSQRKKPPACDYCKARRVLCHPQLNGPCPRCVEKGVECSTTPVVRRRRRTKGDPVHSAAKATTSSSNNCSDQATCTTPTQSNEELSTVIVVQQWASATSLSNNLDEPSPVPPTLQLSAEVVKALMKSAYWSLFVWGLSINLVPLMIALRNTPHNPHPVTTNPMIPLSQLEMKLLLHAWDLHSLSYQDRVLTYCLLTCSALCSTDPFILGTIEIGPEESQIIDSVTPLKSPIVPDMRHFGFRREPVVRQLWAESLWLANQACIATNTSIENAASCWILGYLRYVMFGKTSAFSAACVHHMRTLAEDGKLSRDADEMLKFRGHMMIDSLYALMTGKTVPFTTNDELLIVPHKLEPLEQLISTFLTRNCTSSDVFLSVHTFSHTIVRLARETAENLSGPYARSQPLDECFLIKHFASLDVFHSLLSAALQQISRLIQSRFTQEMTYHLHACAHGFVVAWGSLIITVFERLRDRLMYNTTDNSRVGDGFSSDISVAAEMKSSRLLVHLLHARKLASRTAVEISETMRDVPSIVRLMPHGDLTKWARYLLEEENIIDITRAQSLQALECFRDALKVVGFSHADRTGIVDTINEYLTAYLVDDMFTQLGHSIQDSERIHGPDWFEIGASM
ncbi:hypothetical protein F5876DRAFT_74090 [Lentinula aff. lateritia]|uniref:Uncharacterized protein n=1 Tax=Lentinula aff. lateritia TaxID=2804960 RepID=A0ACC1U8T9_9AGAR|nr:hypothetical protein F5876DRAFT_74090 [Lentinula aff. lateritia]